jgi:hypothetical protein
VDTRPQIGTLILRAPDTRCALGGIHHCGLENNDEGLVKQLLCDLGLSVSSDRPGGRSRGLLFEGNPWMIFSFSFALTAAHCSWVAS